MSPDPWGGPRKSHNSSVGSAGAGVGGSPEGRPQPLRRFGVRAPAERSQEAELFDQAFHHLPVREFDTVLASLQGLDQRVFRAQSVEGLDAVLAVLQVFFQRPGFGIADLPEQQSSQFLELWAGGIRGHGLLLSWTPLTPLRHFAMVCGRALSHSAFRICAVEGKPVTKSQFFPKFFGRSEALWRHVGNVPYYPGRKNPPVGRVRRPVLPASLPG